ncbi:MAG: rhomboid family intramembrane serine protease [Cyclobacteriaceae bacterium]|nr:rhomboid family intramembrane serine protease [Cyclobacteriaceae bacterium]
MFRNITPVVQRLLLINIAIFLAANFFIPVLDDWFALYNIKSPLFKPFQFLTYMFMHADFWHLFSNMFGLMIFGPLLEQFLGPKKLFTLCKVLAFESNPDPEYFNRLVIENKGYFTQEVFDFVDQYSRNPQDPAHIQQAEQTLQNILRLQVNQPMVGASGALFGILVAFAMLFPNTQLFLLFPPMPIKAKYLVFFYGAYTIYNVLITNPSDNVAHFAHLSGLVIGAILVYVWKKNRTNFY